MGVINVETNLQFRSSKSLFDRIKKRLSSFDAEGLIDEGDFHAHVKYVLEQLGQAVYKEHEAILHVIDYKTKLPFNFTMFHAAYRCSFNFKGIKSINEQKPIIYYTDTEISKVYDDRCKLDCCQEEGKTKIVIRTYVNGEDNRCVSNNSPCLLTLSSHVGTLCTEDSLSLFCPGSDEITIDDDKVVHTMFDKDSIYLQYYGLPLDEYELPMIPDQGDIEKAIEYYIYSQLFEEFYWNSTVPGISGMLKDAREQYDIKYLPAARYWAKLPSFARMVNSIRRQRKNRKFFYIPGDRTIVHG